MTRCACGQVFDVVKDLRVHIALETECWPIELCSREHHDPLNRKDLAVLRWQERFSDESDLLPNGD